MLISLQSPAPAPASGTLGPTLSSVSALHTPSFITEKSAPGAPPTESLTEMGMGASEYSFHHGITEPTTPYTPTIGVSPAPSTPGFGRATVPTPFSASKVYRTPAQIDRFNESGYNICCVCDRGRGADVSILCVQDDGPRRAGRTLGDCLWVPAVKRVDYFAPLPELRRHYAASCRIGELGPHPVRVGLSRWWSHGILLQVSVAIGGVKSAQQEWQGY